MSATASAPQKRRADDRGADLEDLTPPAWFIPKARIPSKGAMNHVGDVSSSEVNGPPAKAQKVAEPPEEYIPAGQPSPSRGRTADEVVEDSADEERCTFLPRRPWGRELDGEGGWSRIEWG